METGASRFSFGFQIREKETGVGEDEDEQTGPRILVEGLSSLHFSNPNKNGKRAEGL